MSNYDDNGSQQNYDSLFDNLMQPLGLDPHQHSTPQPCDHSFHDFSQQHHYHADPLNFNWDLNHFEHQNTLHNAGISNLTNSCSDDSSALSFEYLGSELHNSWQEHHHTNWINPLPDSVDSNYHQTPGYWDCSTNSQHSDIFCGMQEHGYHSLNMAAERMVMESSRSVMSDGPYITSTEHGRIYLHRINGTEDWVGRVDGGHFYNTERLHLGHLSNDGKIYDHYDHFLGWVQAGHVYNEKGIEVGRADNDMQGAAHMIFAVRGGVQ